VEQGNAPCQDRLDKALASPQGTRDPPAQYAHCCTDKHTDQTGRPASQPGKALQGGEQAPIERHAKHPGQQTEHEKYR